MRVRPGASKREPAIPRVLGIVCLALGLGGCLSADVEDAIAVEERVDLQRFMGAWYVVGNIPTPFEREAYNAVERYELGEDGRIETTFTFRKGSFEGSEKEYQPTGFVVEGTGNAVWKMQFVWPFKADYRIVHVDDDYRYTIIGRNARDYLWIMSRDPDPPEDDYERLVEIAAAQGYDPAEIRRVPQRWE
jgi:apolipoprotein D and lipocalin family protein